MIKKNAFMWALGIAAVSVLTGCHIDMPQETVSSFETMIIILMTLQ